MSHFETPKRVIDVHGVGFIFNDVFGLFTLIFWCYQYEEITR